MSRPRFIPAVLAAGLLIGFGALAPQAHADDGPFVHAVMAADAPTFISGGNATWTATLTNVGTVDIAGLTSAALVMTDCAITQADGTTQASATPGSVDLPIGSTAVCHGSTIVTEPAGTRGFWFIRDLVASPGGQLVATDDTSVLQADYLATPSSPAYRVDTSVDATESPTLTYNVVVTNTGDVRLLVDIPITQFTGSGTPTITSTLTWSDPFSCGLADGTPLVPVADGVLVLRAVVDPGLSATCTVSYTITAADLGKVVGLTGTPVAQTLARQPVTAAADSVLTAAYTVPADADVPEITLVHAVLTADAPTFLSGGLASWTLTVTNVGATDISGLWSTNFDTTNCVITLVDGTSRVSGTGGVDLPINSTAVCHWSTLVSNDEPAGTSGSWTIHDFRSSPGGQRVATDSTSVLTATFIVVPSSPSYRVDTSVDATKSPTLTYNVVVTNTGDVRLLVDIPITQFTGSGTPTITSTLNWSEPSSCGLADGTPLVPVADGVLVLRAVVDPGLSATCTVSYTITAADLGKVVGLTGAPAAQTLARQPVTAAADSVLTAAYTVPKGAYSHAGGVSADTRTRESLALAVLLVAAGVAALRVRQRWVATA